MAGVGQPRLIIRSAASRHASADDIHERPSDAPATADADVIFLIDGAMETALSGPVDALPGHAEVVRLADAHPPGGTVEDDLDGDRLVSAGRLMGTTAALGRAHQDRGLTFRQGPRLAL